MVIVVAGYSELAETINVCFGEYRKTNVFQCVATALNKHVTGAARKQIPSSWVFLPYYDGENIG
jgi:hypothetical protein